MARVWVVTGGAESGGLLVRQSAELSSAQEKDRLSYGAVVQQLDLKGDRLRYKLLGGEGPETGWVSTRLQDKQLAVPAVPDALLAGRSRASTSAGGSSGSSAKLRCSQASASCPSCSGQMEWSDHAEGPYAGGWQCRHIRRCGSRRSTRGPSRWFCCTCTEDVCGECHPAPAQEGDSAASDPPMVFYAISDVHVECKQNMQWLQELPRFERSCALVAGDLGVSLSQVRDALLLLRQKFDYVFYCFGNHECWVAKIATDNPGFADSFGKLAALRAMCEEAGALTTPQLVEGVWVVPVLGWYHDTWDTEPPLQPPPGRQLSRQPRRGVEMATDSVACKWTGFENGSEALAEKLDQQNEAWGCWPLPAELLAELDAPKGQRRPVITFSHFLPRIELMPEKRFLFHPGLLQVVGSKHVRKRVESLKPDLHVFGHTHFPWDMTLDGVRYRSWPLGMPDEQARRITSYPAEEVEKWHPLPVFDSDGNHFQGHEACWFSNMYTRIPREPGSCRMAEYVAHAYCPEAPTVPSGIISHGLFVEPATEEQWWRRMAYAGQSNRSMGSKVAAMKAAGRPCGAA